MYKSVLASILGTTCVLCTCAGSLFAQRGQPTKATPFNEALKGFVRRVLNLEEQKDDSEDTRITLSRVPPRGKARAIVLVYVTGSSWCGSGGCTLLILEPREASFKLLGRLTVVQLPIWLLPSTSNGYPDIGVGVRGGGSNPVEYEVKLSFDGSMYPGNPSLPPAQKIPFGRGLKLISATVTSSALN